jgi:hypothetical protein
LSYGKSTSFAARTKLTNRIFTTNEGIATKKLEFHHEQARTSPWPFHIFFCRLKLSNPGNSRAASIANSKMVYQKLAKKHSHFLEKQHEKYWLQHTSVYVGPKQDMSKRAGCSWKSFFHVNMKEECEQE